MVTRCLAGNLGDRKPGRKKDVFSIEGRRPGVEWGMGHHGRRLLTPVIRDGVSKFLIRPSLIFSKYGPYKPRLPNQVEILPPS